MAPGSPGPERARQTWRYELTLTRIILPAAILLGAASASFAMSPTGQSYRPYAGAYASTQTVTAPAVSRSTVLAPSQAELADRQSYFYRR